jgi:hypothetical protein
MRVEAVWEAGAGDRGNGDKKLEEQGRNGGGRRGRLDVRRERSKGWRKGTRWRKSVKPNDPCDLPLVSNIRKQPSSIPPLYIRLSRVPSLLLPSFLPASCILAAPLLLMALSHSQAALAVNCLRPASLSPIFLLSSVGTYLPYCLFEF